MSDPHTEGLAKAGRALFEREYSFDWHAENLTDSMSVESMFVREADAAVTAYLGHTHPVVESVEVLLDLPNGTLIKDRDGRERFLAGRDREGLGWWSSADAAHHLDEHDITLPATVIHRPTPSERRHPTLTHE